MKHSSFAGAFLLCLAFFGAISAQESPDSVTRGTKQFHKKVLVSGLEGPWELTWGPDNMLWVTERTGKRVTASTRPLANGVLRSPSTKFPPQAVRTDYLGWHCIQNC